MVTPVAKAGSKQTSIRPKSNPSKKHNNKMSTKQVMSLLLKITAESGIPRKSTSKGLLKLPDRQKQQQLKKQQQTPSHSNIVIKDRDGGDQWVISIKKKLNQASQDDVAGTRGKLSIYKVPQHLRQGAYDYKAYVPQIVSLGPYHHGKKRLRQMDSHKWRSLHVMLKRTKHDIKDYTDSMRELEEKARACYEGPIGLSSNEFVEMMVLDGCFVLELFQGADEEFTKIGYSRNDPVFTMRGSMHLIQRDMMMLENQLPLFILDRLLRLQGGNRDQKGPVSKLALGFFKQLTPTDEPSTKNTTVDTSSDQEGLHCLDVFRKSLLQSGPQDQNKSENTALASDQGGLRTPTDEPSTKKTTVDTSSDQEGLHCLDVFRKILLRSEPQDLPKIQIKLIHCVTELREAGIKFKKRETDCFWDIKFENGILWIPRLFIDDGTKSLFLNLIAFEQSHLDCSNVITSYVFFMDNLINSPEDVGYLHYRGIIEHWLGSDAEVSDLFNRLCREVAFDNDDSYLSQLSVDVNKYYNHRWNVWCASLRHNYFNNPWAIISVVAAVWLLLLTSVQAFYGAYSYHRPRS